MKTHPKIIDRILEVIREHQTFCIVGHIRPDGDCIGSQLGLALALHNEGKKVTCLERGSDSAKTTNFSIPTTCSRNPKPARNSTASSPPIARASSGWARSANASASGKCSSTLIITKATRATRDINWVSPREAVQRRIDFPPAEGRRAGRSPSPSPIACSPPFPPTPARFNIRPRGPARFISAAELVTRGANLAKICDEVYQSYPLSRARLLKHVYSKFRLTHDDQIAYFWLKKADFTRTGAEQR